MESEVPVCTYAAAGGVVVDGSGQRVLVLVRARRKGPGGSPEIRLPKGHVEPGEARREAALREVREESGLSNLVILADLGRQMVSFTWDGVRYLRDERYFLMAIRSEVRYDRPEAQFERLWLPWADAATRLTFEAEREWVRRAHNAWKDALQNVPDQNSQ
jgi:8-oxo-dGTP pyrophosphatase MutT (NUDIX family)